MFAVLGFAAAAAPPTFIVSSRQGSALQFNRPLQVTSQKILPKDLARLPTGGQLVAIVDPVIDKDDAKSLVGVPVQILPKEVNQSREQAVVAKPSPAVAPQRSITRRYPVKVRSATHSLKGNKDTPAGQNVGLLARLGFGTSSLDKKKNAATRKQSGSR